MVSRKILDHGGFTLVEVLVASAIMALVGAMLFGAFDQTIKSGAGAEERSNLYHTARFIIRKVTEDVHAATQLPYRDTKTFFGFDHPAEEERQWDELRFTSFARRPLFGSGSDQAEIAWYVTRSEEDPEKLFTLWRRETPLLTWPKGSEPEDDKLREEAVDITDRLVSFNIRYFFRNRWFDSFDRGGRAPMALELSFTLEDKEGRRLSRRVLASLRGGKT